MLLDEIKNIKSSRKDLRNFGLSVGTVLALIGGLLLWKARGSYPYFLIPGGVLIFLGLTFPVILKPLQQIWMTLALILGWFMTRVILSILFFLVITPIGLFSKLIGKQFLDLKWDKNQKTYWNYRDASEAQKKDYTKQF
jgi:hypothetical protein